MDEEERERTIRTNEDPYLVGEEAAAKNKEERLRKENRWGVLEREDRRWDWLLGEFFKASYTISVYFYILIWRRREDNSRQRLMKTEKPQTTV